MQASELHRLQSLLVLGRTPCLPSLFEESEKFVRPIGVTEGFFFVEFYAEARCVGYSEIPLVDARNAFEHIPRPRLKAVIKVLMD